MKTKLAVILSVLLAFMACTNAPTNQPTALPIAVGNPADGATLSDPLTITASLGQGYTFTRVDFYIDSLMVVSDTTYPFQYNWNIFALQSGSNHTIYVVGFTADSTFISPAISVRVEFTLGFSLVSTYSPGSLHAIGITNYYGVLFVSTGDDGLHVLDISNKFAPVFRSKLVTGGQALHSDVLFPNVLIAERDQGVEMANFMNVDSLVPGLSYHPQSLVKDVTVSNHFIFSVENDGLSILAPSTLQAYSRRAITQDLLNYVVARHDTAFIVGNNYFYIIDCTNPNASQLVGSYDNLNLAQSVAVVDTFAFIANGVDGIIALSIASPASPRFLARYNPGQIMNTVAVGNGFLFAGSGSNVVYALDYSVAGSLTPVASFNVGNIVEEIKVNSNYVFVAANSDVDILRFVP